MTILLLFAILVVTAGLTGLIFGGELFVDSATDLARSRYAARLRSLLLLSYCETIIMTRNINMDTITAKHVYKFSDIAISGGIIIAGILLTILIPSPGLGICTILTGLCVFPFLKTGYRIPGQKEMYSHKDYLLPQECKSDIAAYIEGKSETLDIDPFKKGGLLLERYYLKNGSKQFVQLFDYTTGIYSAQCELTEIDREKLEEILKYQ